MKKNKGKFSFTLLQAIGTVFKSFILVGLLGGIAAMMIGSFILIKTIETAPELDVSKFQLKLFPSLVTYPSLLLRRSLD